MEISISQSGIQVFLDLHDQVQWEVTTSFYQFKPEPIAAVIPRKFKNKVLCFFCLLIMLVKFAFLWGWWMTSSFHTSLLKMTLHICKLVCMLLGLLAYLESWWISNTYATFAMYLKEQQKGYKDWELEKILTKTIRREVNKPSSDIPELQPKGYKGGKNL